MIAIHTKFLGATNTRGAKIKAYTANWGNTRGLSATVSYPYGLSGAACHFEAVKELVKKHDLDWNINDMVYGDSVDGKGYCFCFAQSKIIDSI